MNQSRRSPILDRVNPKDFLHLSMTYCCEQCSHFDETTTACTIGYNAEEHLRETQAKLYERTGRVAFCGFLEID